RSSTRSPTRSSAAPEQTASSNGSGNWKRPPDGTSWPSFSSSTTHKIPRMKPTRQTSVLRKALQSGCLAMPGAYNAATALLIERAGFDGVYVSGAGLANATAGVPDIGLLTLAEVSQLAGYIARAVAIPALVDADTGFGGADNCARTVSDFELAGTAG